MKRRHSYETVQSRYPDAAAVIDDLLGQLRPALADNFVGMYLFGSLALGDFISDRSDVDYLVITEHPATGSQTSALAEIHRSLFASGLPLVTEIEASYIPRSAVRRHDPADALHPHIDRGESVLDPAWRHEMDWIVQRHVLRERGVVVAGPPIDSFIDPVPATELKHAVTDYLREWLLPMVNSPGPLEKPGYRVYVVLTLCRIIYTLRHGDVVSKSAAARWALGVLPAEWHGLIADADRWRNNDPFDRLGELQRFIRFVVDDAGRWIVRNNLVVQRDDSS